MPKLCGKQHAKESLLQRVGDLSQIGGVKRVELKDRNEAGVGAAEFRAGFAFTVLAGQDVDISSAEHRGRSLCWRP